MERKGNPAMTQQCRVEDCEGLVELVQDEEAKPVFWREGKHSRSTVVVKPLKPNEKGLCYYHRRVAMYIVGSPYGITPLFQHTFTKVGEAVRRKY